jgi:hypothetical protein
MSAPGLQIHTAAKQMHTLKIKQSFGVKMMSSTPRLIHFFVHNCTGLEDIIHALDKDCATGHVKADLCLPFLIDHNPGTIQQLLQLLPPVKLAGLICTRTPMRWLDKWPVK